MMRRKIERSKTQKKESQSILPSLKIPSRLITMESFFAPNQTRKFSQNLTKKQPTKKQKFQLKKFVDENIYQIITRKNSTKIIKKKIYNQLITIQQIGPNTLLAKSSLTSNIIDYAYDQYQGLRDYNQDRILTNLNVRILDKIYNIFGVFDGHGGSFASEYVKNNFVKNFQEQMNENPLLNVMQNLRKSIYKLQSKLNDLYRSKQFVGGTCASILIFHDNSYYIAHLGDSRILQVKLANQKFQYQQLTTDHKPDQRGQKSRIQNMGGKVYRNKLNMNNNDYSESYGPYRIIPGKLSVSRTIADFQVKNLPNGSVITCEPQLLEGKIEQTSLFLLFSDGAYEKFENSQIVEYFSKKKKIQDIQIRKSIQSFLINSILKQSSDNISIISLIVKEKKLIPE